MHASFAGNQSSGKSVLMAWPVFKKMKKCQNSILEAEVF